jgi:hypothetical protein
LLKAALDFAAQDVNPAQKQGRRRDSSMTDESSTDQVLSEFLHSNAGAQRAAAALKSGAEVAIRFTNIPGDWRICVDDAGKLSFEPTKATDPDFELYLPPAAVQEISDRADADIGELGVTFFERIVTKEPHRRIGIKVHSGFVKLTRRGWLGVLALGGTKVMSWIAGRGLRGPGAVATALGRLKG